MNILYWISAFGSSAADASRSIVRNDFVINAAAETTKSQAPLSPLWTSVLWTAGAAILAAIAAALLARSLKISEFRQAWIDDLRADVADFIGEVRAAHGAATLASAEFTVSAKDIWDTSYTPAMNKAAVLLSRIRLRINPAENKNKVDDEAFLTACSSLLAGCRDRANPCADLDARCDEVESKARSLLKREWETTKRAGIS